MKGVQIKYSAAELAWLEANRTLVISDYHSEFCRRFERVDVTAIQLHALRKRKGWRTGRTGAFAKGMTPHNKGKACPPGYGGRHPNARKAHFRKGALNGRAADHLKPLGTERINKDGHRERKVSDQGSARERWRQVHRMEWEAINGPVPAGYVLKCLGDKLNVEPSNWTLIPRAMLPRLNSRYSRDYDNAPAELKPAIMAITRLEYEARKRTPHPARPERAGE